MMVTRRRFLGRGATLGASMAAVAAARTILSEPDRALAACSAVPSASPEIVALNRLSYGPSAQAQSAYRQIGLSDTQRYEAWVTAQLAPASIDDAACEQKLAATRLKISYGAVNEVRPLSLLGAGIAPLWGLATNPSLDWSERQRPYNEVRVATWIRAVYSRRQLYELMVDFWHNHFNVKATSDQRIAATWVLYDRDVIRANALGNFRTFVEAVGSSVAMMYYLDNLSNRAAGGEGGNENYARELFELHTLGSDNYLKFYNDRSKIETITYGGKVYPKGYIDYDVYNASRCLTGWTIANGQNGRPNTGVFYYEPSWHDTYEKTVLAPRPLAGYAPAPNIPFNQPALKDGKDVFDLVCYHPGTARHICTKLCRRFIADDPPQVVIDRAVEVWMANLNAPDQIARVLRSILLSDACQTNYGQKVKRPLEAIWSYLRAAGADLPSDVVSVSGDTSKGAYWAGIFYHADQSGHRLFGWDTPTGHPDQAEYWANTNGMLSRWNMVYNLTQSWGGKVEVDIVGQTPAGASCSAIVDFWIGRLCGFEVSSWVRNALISFLAQGGNPAAPPQPLKGPPDWGDITAVYDRLESTVQLLAMSPDFHLR
jgi:uncharacterized protein (DUF1800 family)